MHLLASQHREFDPPPALRDAIKCFWYDTRDMGEAASAFEVLPDGWVEIVFQFGSACSLPSPCIMGLLGQPATLRARGRIDIIGVRCYPWAVFDLLGQPAGMAGVRMLEHPIARLQPALARCVHAGRIEEALAHLARHLLQARPHIALDGMLARAGAALREGQGSMPVSEVAVAAHASVRTLERRFKQVSGHTVKAVSSLIRFEQVRNALVLDPHAGIAGLAHALGYVDQSHLSREFRRYSGTSPAAFAGRRHLHGESGGFVQA
jgi:AraC-like DNA-binding protein